jgi:hypothetical protein
MGVYKTKCTGRDLPAKPLGWWRSVTCLHCGELYIDCWCFARERTMQSVDPQCESKLRARMKENGTWPWRRHRHRVRLVENRGNQHEHGE